MLGNTVYSNGVGIVADGIDFDWRSRIYGEDVENNLVYANTAEGVVVTEGIGTQLVNNTVYQIVGDAVQVNGSSQNITILNNILWTQAGYDLTWPATASKASPATTMTFMPRPAARWHSGVRMRSPSMPRPPIR